MPVHTKKDPRWSSEEVCSSRDKMRSSQDAGLCLQLEDERPHVGLLMHREMKREVSILHRKTNGDALVHDGRRILMVPAKCIRRKEELVKLQELDGQKRLMLVKSIYEKFCSGELESGYIREQCIKHGIEL